jgi:hypothetical protein
MELFVSIVAGGPLREHVRLGFRRCFMHDERYQGDIGNPSTKERGRPVALDSQGSDTILYFRETSSHPTDGSTRRSNDDFST